MTFSANEEDRLWREPEKAHWFRFPNPLRYVIVLIVLIGVLVGLWYLLFPSRQGYNGTDLPLIKAEQEPYKVKAASKGVPSVKHQDKLVYGRIRSDKTEPIAEHILPDPEPPLPHIENDQAPLKMVEQYAPQEIDPDKVAEAINQKSEEKETSLASIADLIDEGEPEQKKPEKAIAKGKIYLQLGSLKTYELAESEWERLSKKHSDLLEKCEPIIQKVDLGAEQGIYYRLRTGPFENGEKANEVQKALQKRKVECVVLK